MSSIIPITTTHRLYLSNKEREDTHLRLQFLCRLSCVSSCSLRTDDESCRAVSLLHEFSGVSPSPSSPECHTYIYDICTSQCPPQPHVACGSCYTLPIPVAADRVDIFLLYCCYLISTLSLEFWTERGRHLEMKYHATL